MAQVTITEDIVSQGLGPRTLAELDANNPLTREDVVVYLGGAVSQIVNQYPEPEREITGRYIPQVVLGELGMTHVALTQLAEVWEECLRVNSWVEEARGVSFIHTWDQNHLKSKAIALERQKSDELVAMAAMQHILRRAPHLLKFTIPAVHEATLESGHLRYTLAKDTRDLPLGFSQRKIAENAFPSFIINIGIAKFGGLTIRELLDAYEVLTSLSSLFLQGNLVFSGNRVRLLDADLPKFLVSDLGRLLKEALSWDDNKVLSCLQAFIYRTRKPHTRRRMGKSLPFSRRNAR